MGTAVSGSRRLASGTISSAASSTSSRRSSVNDRSPSSSSRPRSTTAAHRALRAIVRELAPERLVLVVQERQTRLDKVAIRRLASRVPAFEMLDAPAPRPYPPTWLHAKFLLARTQHGDVLLQGSPNASTVALTEYGENANVELANLLDGQAGTFDPILHALDLRPIPFDTFEPQAFDETAHDSDVLPVINTVTWTPPRLEGRIRLTLAPGTALQVLVGDGTVVVPATVATEVVGDYSVFTLEFAPDDAALIDVAAGLRVEIVDVLISQRIYPYHVNDLVRLTSSGHRVDLLREAGTLDLDDRELEELLAELDRVLIVDGRSLWRLAHPDDTETADEEDGPHVAYDDLDWDTIDARAHAQAVSDPSRSARSSHPQTSPLSCSR